jgi:hypothetical protein
MFEFLSRYATSGIQGIDEAHQVLKTTNSALRFSDGILNSVRDRRLGSPGSTPKKWILSPE